MSDLNELDQLESELNTMLGADAKYWRENDAKFRAVAQNATFEQFEDIVKASHLKPLAKTDKLQSCKPMSSIWNKMCAGQNAIAAATSSKKVSGQTDAPGSLETDKPAGCGDRLVVEPKSVEDFHLAWRGMDIIERFQFVRGLGETCLTRIFSVDIPPELLGDFLHTFLAFGSDLQDTVTVVKTLEILARAKRFNLSRQFLSSTEKDAASQLMEKLKMSLVDRQQDLAELGVTEYNVQELTKKFQG